MTSSWIVSVVILFAGKLTLAGLASKATFRFCRLGGYVPAWIAAYFAGMMLVAVLWALSGVNP